MFGFFRADLAYKLLSYLGYGNFVPTPPSKDTRWWSTSLKKDGEIALHTLYRFEETAVLDSGRIQGFLKKAGTLCHTDKLMAAGLSV